jgi:hypothetical protein
VTILDNKGQASLEGWVLALIGGRTFLGRLTASISAPDDRALEPVYEIASMLTPQGPQFIAGPPIWLTSLRRLPLNDSAVTIALTTLSESDQRKMEGLIKTAEQNVANMRAAESGLALAGPGFRVGPMGGGRQ